MSIQSDYDDMLEDQVCPRCGRTGMRPNGGFDWECPDCGYEGSFEDDDRE